MIHTLSWIAIVILAMGHMAQIYRIHQHKEVRDLSPWMYIFWIAGCSILALEGIAVESPVFACKNILMIVLMSTILGQIWYHQRDHWHDDDDGVCNDCGAEQESEWVVCPYCGLSRVKIK